MFLNLSGLIGRGLMYVLLKDQKNIEKNTTLTFLLNKCWSIVSWKFHANLVPSSLSEKSLSWKFDFGKQEFPEMLSQFPNKNLSELGKRKNLMKNFWEIETIFFSSFVSRQRDRFLWNHYRVPPWKNVPRNPGPFLPVWSGFWLSSQIL